MFAFDRPRSGQARLRLALAATATLVCCDVAHGSEAQLLPFFSKPYPFGYTDAVRAPEAECWQFRRVDTLLGSYIERVWVCGRTLRERY